MNIPEFSLVLQYTSAQLSLDHGKTAVISAVHGYEHAKAAGGTPNARRRA